MARMLQEGLEPPTLGLLDPCSTQLSYQSRWVPTLGIKPRTFRSSVWRSPNWAIAATFRLCHKPLGMMYVLRCYLCATTSDVVVIIEVYLLVLLMLSIAYVECSDRRHAGGLLLSFQSYVYLYEELCFFCIYWLLLSLPRVDCPWRDCGDFRHDMPVLAALQSLLGSIVVSIPACHAGDRGSIPRRGDQIFFWSVFFFNFFF